MFKTQNNSETRLLINQTIIIKQHIKD